MAVETAGGLGFVPQGVFGCSVARKSQKGVFGLGGSRHRGVGLAVNSRLQATANFKADHINAYDSDCDDEAITNTIFMEKFSPVGSINDDMVELRYDSDILSEAPHYDTYHDSDMLNSNIQEMEYIENIVSNNESYDKLSSNSNVIPYTDYKLTIRNNADNYVPPPIQKNNIMFKFDECIKRKTTLSPHLIGSWEQSDIKGAFKKDVIPFSENLKETFKLFEKGFIVEVKEMKDIFEQIEDEVDQLRGKFLDDFPDNAFSGTNGEDAVEHIEYFLKINDPIDLPNVNYERLRLAIFPILLVGTASKWLTWNYLLMIRTKTYENYECELNNEVGEPWSNDGVSYELCNHICEPFCFKNGKTKWPTCNSNEVGFFNDGELPRMVRVGYMTYFLNYEWYDNLTDSSFKEEALKQKAIYEKSWGDATQSVINFCAWLKRSFEDFYELDYALLVKLEECWRKINDHECCLFANWRDHIRGSYANINTTHDPYLDGRNGRACNNNENQEREEQHKEGQCDLFNDPARELPVCKIRRFEMIKYSFRQEEEYVAIKDYEYVDLTRTNEDACHAYQEIFRNMDEGRLVTRAE
ncbi:hypothetical protein Tco_0231376 [Tanacetum coccineum]